MSTSYDINEELGLVTVKITDEVDLLDLCAIGSSLLDDPALNAELPHLVDARGIRPICNRPLTTLLKRFLTTEYAPSIKGSIAIVIDDSLDNKACATLFHISCQMQNTELFDRYEQALKWLMKREFAAHPPRLKQVK